MVGLWPYTARCKFTPSVIMLSCGPRRSRYALTSSVLPLSVRLSVTREWKVIKTVISRRGTSRLAWNRIL